MIDLRLLKYGTEYYVLPPNNIVFMINYVEILKKLDIDDIVSHHKLIHHNNEEQDVSIIQNNNGFTFHYSDDSNIL